MRNRPFLHYLLLLLMPLSHAARGQVIPRTTGTTSNPPVFLSGSAAGYADYTQQIYKTLPVGKSLVVPLVVSGSGPMTYTVTSASPALQPIIKTGYPALNIAVSYSGTLTVSSTAQAFYSFSGGGDGGMPEAALYSSSDGGLYGTTISGTGNAGTIFRINSSRSVATLYAFTGGTDGGHPYGGLTQVTTSGSGSGIIAGFYGVTGSGGTSGSGGYGTVYRFVPNPAFTSGTLTTLYAFTGGADGGYPVAALVAGTDGYLYGTTSSGGSGGQGTLFKISTAGSLTTLHAFTGGADGGNPQAPLILASDGNLYGTTAGETSGSSGSYGTIFQVTTSGSLTTLHIFTSGTDGAHPFSAPAQASGRVFYGTTTTGGTGGYGTVYALSVTSGSLGISGSLTTLHSFANDAGGGSPYGTLLRAGNNNFYGTSLTTGSNGKGSIFQISQGGSFANLYTFSGGADGGSPYAGLAQGVDMNLYGLTMTGGTAGYGTAFFIPASSTPSFSGTMRFALLRDMTPKTCAYIAGLASGGYYGTKSEFFRITNLGSAGFPSFIAQGGDPSNTGTGSPGFTFDNEINPSLIFTGMGQLAMANAGSSGFHGTNGSQFFVTQNNQSRFLDFRYTIFGQLLAGFDTMAKVMAVTLGPDQQTPTVPVVMTSVSVTEDQNDAILIVSAAGSVPGGAKVTVNATDPTGGKAIYPTVSGTATGFVQTFATNDDTQNDPPIITQEPNIEAGANQRLSIPLKITDLEYDFLLTSGSASPGGVGSANVTNGVLNVSSFGPQARVNVGIFSYQPFASDSSDVVSGFTAGFGSGKLTPLPTTLVGQPNNFVSSGTASSLNSGTPALGSFLCSNPLAAPGDFTATVNWGDGTVVSNSNSITISRSPALPTRYDVTAGSHTYAAQGIYPVVVTISQTNGGILAIQDSAVVTGSNIFVLGRGFAAAKGSFSGLVAQFQDRTLRGSFNGIGPADYAARINWGDGAITDGTVRGSGFNYEVFGSHKYAFGTTYPVGILVTSRLDSGSRGYGWGMAAASGIPTRQPPYAQAHVNGQLGNPGYGAGYFDAEVTLFNSGNKPSGQVQLKFYLSASPQIDSSSVALLVNGNATYSTVSIPAGSAISGAVSKIYIPAGTTTRGKYLVMRIIASDPIGSHMPYTQTFADPNPLF